MPPTTTEGRDGLKTPPRPDAELLLARDELRRREAAWRRQRAEVARLVAAGESRAAERLLAEIGDPPAELADVSAPASEPIVGETLLPETLLPETSLPDAPRPDSVRSPAPSRPTEPPPAARKRQRERNQDGARLKAKRLATQIRQRRRVRPRRRPPASWRSWFERRPPWALSLVVHAALLVLLGLATFATWAEPPLYLTASLEEGDDWEQATVQLELDAPAVDAETPAEPVDTPVEIVELTSLVAPVELTSLSDTAPGAGVLADAGALMAEAGASAGAGQSQAAAPAPAAKPTPAGRVSFFGAESVANRVVFVVDNSGSMQRGRMETTLMELQRAVGRLSHSQSFYVVFFSDQAYPMFHPEPHHEMLPANRENKRRLANWLPSVQMCLGGRLLDAVEMAAMLEPQAVFLLSDGDIRSPRVMKALTDPDAWEFTIHTIGMGARDRDDAGKLAAIATANGGSHRLVTAHPKAVARSLRQPIPYNREPGPVWGTLVRPWR